MKAVAQGQNIPCDNSAKNYVSGSDIAYLSVDLSKFPRGSAQFTPLPLASSFWNDSLSGVPFSGYRVQGYEPDSPFARITRQVADAQPYGNADGTFSLGNNFLPGFSGSAIVGDLPGGGYAVVGLATNRFPIPPTDYQAGKFDEVPYLISDQMQMQIGPASQGLGLDLGYLSKSAPSFPANDTLNRVYQLSSGRVGVQQKRELQQIVANLPGSMDQVQLVRHFTRMPPAQTRKMRKHPQFFITMSIIEQGWCWNTGTFYDLSSAEDENPVAQVKAIASAQSTLGATKPPANGLDGIASMRVAYTRLESIAPRRCDDGGPNCPATGPLISQARKDRATAAVRLALASPTAENLDRLKVEFPDQKAPTVDRLGLEKSAADAFVQAAQKESDENQRTDWLVFARKKYAAILGTGKADSNLAKQIRSSDGLAATLSGQTK